MDGTRQKGARGGGEKEEKKRELWEKAPQFQHPGRRVLDLPREGRKSTGQVYKNQRRGGK